MIELLRTAVKSLVVGVSAGIGLVVVAATYAQVTIEPRPFVNGAGVALGPIGYTAQAVTVDGATTFAVTSSYVTLACTGAETINTITGGIAGMRLLIEHTDTDCTVADDDAATAADAVDLTGTASNDVGAAAKLLMLHYNGTHWLELSESDN